MAYLFSFFIVLTAIAWVLHKAGFLKICPVCVAGLITWVIGVVLIYYGSAWADPIFTAILIGTTLGAIAEKYGNRYGFVWKTAWIIFGLTSAYNLLEKNPIASGVFIGLSVVATLIFRPPSVNQKNSTDQFKNCC